MQKNNCLSGVYAVLVIAIGMFYVGSALDMVHRWERQHLPKLRRNAHENELLQAAFNEHGEESCALIPVEIVHELQRLPELERFHILNLKSAGLSLNKSTSGTPGMRGLNHSRETRLKMSAAKRKKGVALPTFISPNGETFTPEILNEFCTAHGLSSGAMSRVAQGKQSHHKGWRIAAEG
jgi:group I intron endonuclease